LEEAELNGWEKAREEKPKWNGRAVGSLKFGLCLEKGHNFWVSNKLLNWGTEVVGHFLVFVY
jgi:hypothetical protein